MSQVSVQHGSLFQGWLNQHAPSMLFKRWRKRWAVLTAESLVLFKSPSLRKKTDCICLAGVVVNSGVVQSALFSLEVCSVPMHTFAATSLKEKEAWKLHIDRASLTHNPCHHIRCYISLGRSDAGCEQTSLSLNVSASTFSQVNNSTAPSFLSSASTCSQVDEVINEPLQSTLNLQFLGPAAVAELEKVLQTNPEAVVRKVAAAMLGDFAQHPGLALRCSKVLSSALESDSDATVRRMIVEALSFAIPEGVAASQAALLLAHHGDVDASVRRRAREALSVLDTQSPPDAASDCRTHHHYKTEAQDVSLGTGFCCKDFTSSLMQLGTQPGGFSSGFHSSTCGTHLSAESAVFFGSLHEPASSDDEIVD